MKKTNNKGFSLVELIVVIAIMGVLMVVLAPQYLKFVEKSRLQKDNSAISEVANTIKIALSDEPIAQEVSDGETITLSSTAHAWDATSAKLNAELASTISAQTPTLASGTYDSATVTLTINKVNGVFTVTTSDFIDTVGGSAGSKNF